MDESGSFRGRLFAARSQDDPIEQERLRASMNARLLGEATRPPSLGRYVILRAVGAGATPPSNMWRLD
jgi:hypothetical protein